MFKVGDKVILVDHPTWHNDDARKYIGLVTEITAIGVRCLHGHMNPGPAIAPYCVRVPHHGAPCDCLCVAPEHIRKIDDDNDSMGDETPNKVVSWDHCPWKPTRINV